MGFRFRKRIKLMPGVSLNLSKGGVSASVGKPGATINVGKNGVKGNVGIPGSGVSYTTKLTGNNTALQGHTEEHIVHQRRVGFLLATGILLVPFIFSWLLLRSGHTLTSRLLGFGWLAVFLWMSISTQ